MVQSARRFGNGTELARHGMVRAKTLEDPSGDVLAAIAAGIDTSYLTSVPVGADSSCFSTGTMASFTEIQSHAVSCNGITRTAAKRHGFKAPGVRYQELPRPWLIIRKKEKKTQNKSEISNQLSPSRAASRSHGQANCRLAKTALPNKMRIL
jgi:hypothetical protein